MRAFGVACLLLLGGCIGHIGDVPDGAGSTTDATATFGSGVGTNNPVAVPFAHLTAAEYQATVQDLFAPLTVPTVSIPADIVVEGFDNNASVQLPSADLVDAYGNAAEAIAAAVMTTPSQLLGCTPTSRDAEDACAQTFFATFAKNAYRRPLDADELTDLQAFYTSRRTAGDDFPTSMTTSLEAILQSPFFVYRVEIGSAVEGRTDIVQLTPYEIASRLSYALWASMPDADLFASADNGNLSTTAGIESEARRMLADPKAHAAIVRFHGEWLGFDVMQSMSKDAQTFPQFTPEVVTAMSSSAQRFVENVFFNGGSLHDLLTDAHAWVNDTLAPIYGVPLPGSDELTLVAVDATQRAGILTNAGLMAGLAHNISDSPVLRGVFVLKQLMCMPTPPPPPGSAAANPPQISSDVPKTTRDLFATQHEQGSCAACHHTIDGIGFGFEHYDAIGAFRTTDNGVTVDASGWFPDGAGDLSGTFNDAIALSSTLADSRSVQACVVSQWMRYALGVDHTGIDVNAVVPILDDFVASGLGLEELVISFVKSDTFRTRLVGN